MHILECKWGILLRFLEKNIFKLLGSKLLSN